MAESISVQTDNIVVSAQVIALQLTQDILRPYARKGLEEETARFIELYRKTLRAVPDESVS